MDIGSISLLDLWGYVKQLGLPGFLLLALVGFHRRWWVMGWQYRKEERAAERAEAKADEWKTAALLGTSLAERGVDHALSSRPGPTS